MTVFIAKISDRKLSFVTPQKFKSFMEGFKDGQTLEVSIGKRKSKRTNQQNRYYFAYLGIISDETGDDVNSLHEFFKRKFLPPTIITALEQEVRVPSSTTDLSKQDMSEYLDRICELSGVPLPDPVALGYDLSPYGYGDNRGIDTEALKRNTDKAYAK